VIQRSAAPKKQRSSQTWTFTLSNVGSQDTKQKELVGNYGLICLYGFLRSMFLPHQALLTLVMVDFNPMFSQI